MMKKSNAHSLALLQITRPVMLIERNTRFLLRLCVICDAIVFTHKEKSGRKSSNVAFVVIATLHRDGVKEKAIFTKCAKPQSSFSQGSIPDSFCQGDRLVSTSIPVSSRHYIVPGSDKFWSSSSAPYPINEKGVMVRGGGERDQDKTQRR
jgi:hypothetical protein